MEQQARNEGNSMSEKTEISWTDATFNPWWGCQKVSPACDHCYAERDAGRFAPGTVLWGVGSERRTFADKHWEGPAKWAKRAFVECPACGWRGMHTALNHEAGYHRCPTCRNDEWRPARMRVFCASMADVGEDRRDLDAPRLRLMALIEKTPWLDWLLLTKRPENMQRLFPWLRWPANVWIGTTVEDQEQADKRIPHLLAIPAAVRFLSVEPMLGEVDLERVVYERMTTIDALNGLQGFPLPHAPGPRVDWVIIGGESGPKARPFDLDECRILVADCADAGVPVFTKQMGERWARETGTHHLDAHGGDPQHWPAGDWPREFPKPRAP